MHWSRLHCLSLWILYLLDNTYRLGIWTVPAGLHHAHVGHSSGAWKYMCTCQCTWGHDFTGSGCSQELFPYVYVTLGVVTSVQKDWEGMGCVRGNWHTVINGAYYHKWSWLWPNKRELALPHLGFLPQWEQTGNNWSIMGPRTHGPWRKQQGWRNSKRANQSQANHRDHHHSETPPAAMQKAENWVD